MKWRATGGVLKKGMACANGHLKPPFGCSGLDLRDHVGGFQVSSETVDWTGGDCGGGDR